MSFIQIERMPCLEGGCRKRRTTRMQDFANNSWRRNESAGGNDARVEHELRELAALRHVIEEFCVDLFLLGPIALLPAVFFSEPGIAFFQVAVLPIAASGFFVMQFCGPGVPQSTIGRTAFLFINLRRYVLVSFIRGPCRVDVEVSQGINISERSFVGSAPEGNQ